MVQRNSTSRRKLKDAPRLSRRAGGISGSSGGCPADIGRTRDHPCTI